MLAWTGEDDLANSFVENKATGTKLAALCFHIGMTA
jgi:hypothetical protein